MESSQKTSNLKLKVDEMSFIEKQGALIFDEIKIRRNAEYNKYIDLVDGMDDSGNNNREIKFGNYICAYMIRELHCNWKYVLSYFFSEKAISRAILKGILWENLEKAFRADTVIRFITSDEGS